MTPWPSPRTTRYAEGIATPRAIPARLHIIAAREAPVAVIFRRKPSKIWHVMRWNTRTDEIEHGSWFQGTIYPDCSDLSPDGRWLLYFCLGSRGHTFNAISQAPSLKGLLYWGHEGTYGAGGAWRTSTRLELNVFDEGSAKGWPRGAHWNFDDPAAQEVFEKIAIGSVRSPSDDGLRRFINPECLDLPERLFGVDVAGVVRNVDNDILVARAGAIERWTPDDLVRGQPTFRLDLEGLQPPAEPPLRSPAPPEASKPPSRGAWPRRPGA